MKYQKQLFFVCLILFAFEINAQTVTYRFTSENNCVYAPLDSVLVRNITQPGDTILYYPDTVLNFTFSGIENDFNANPELNLFQNYPNPFSDETYFDLYVPDAGNVNLSVFDLTGRQVCAGNNFYEPGFYSFKFKSGTGNVFILSVQSETELKKIVMINENDNSVSQPELIFLGRQTETGICNKSKNTFFPYSIGDEINFTGYVTNELSEVNSETISDNPAESTDYTFILNGDVPEQPGVITGQTIICSNQSQTLNYQVVNTPGLVYNWALPDGWIIQSGEGTNSITVLTSGNVGTVSVSAENSCGISPVSDIEINFAAVPEITGDTIYCSNQYIQMEITGGDYWNWSGPSGFSSQSQSINTSAGNFMGGGYFYVTVVDNFGCTYTDEQVFYINNVPQVVIQCTQTATCGLSNGELTVSVTGGVAPYIYTWAVWGTTESQSVVNNLESGYYMLTVMDWNGCAVVGQGIVLQNTDLLLNASTLYDVSCYGGNNGVINADVSGGVLPYYYQWDSGATTQTQSNVPAGHYHVTVTDSEGCTASDYTIVDEPDELIVTIHENSPVWCYGGTDGMLSVQTSGGMSPYFYLWSNGEVSGGINNLSAEVYAVTVWDTNNCTATATYELNQPAPLSVNIVQTSEILCYGDETAALNGNITGGTLSYSYLWNVNGDFTSFPQLNNLAAGYYDVTVTDANNCTAENHIIISQPDELTGVVVNVVNCSSPAAGDGSVSLLISGGTAGYTIDWQLGSAIIEENSYTISDLSPGGYVITITDSNGCTFVFNCVVMSS